MIKDFIKGGLAKNLPYKMFNNNELKKGIKVELEHTPNVNIAREIAKDHLVEFPKYYTELAKMEKRLKKKR